MASGTNLSIIRLSLMKKLTFTSILLLATLLQNTISACEGGKCVGAKYCSSCKNCTRCKHCSSGGVCGVCSPESFEAKKKESKKKPASKPVKKASKKTK